MPRSVPGAETAILRALQLHGFEWDAPPVRQSTRAAAYQEALDRLASGGHVYECACTRREVSAAPIRDGEHVYPGTCRAGIAPGRAHRPRSTRVRVGGARIAFDDRLQGPQARSLDEDAGDFVLRRADGWFAYQLAVVVDDAMQGVTSIVRGADLLASTPRQIFLQRLLGAATPAYLHVPVAVDAAGRKLSKQNGAAALGDHPCGALQAAWRFLGQPPLGSRMDSAGAFWSCAVPAWSPARIPPVTQIAVGV